MLDMKRREFIALLGGAAAAWNSGKRHAASASARRDLFEDFVHIRGGASEQVGQVRSVGHEAPGVYELPCYGRPV